jgi:hypothetical protein
MTSLPPHADQVVRDAVDAFMEGRLVPEFVGETVFETKNSRYRLVDGVVVVGPDPSLVGAELVGWLCESSRRCLVESAWQPGSRAVLVDRQRGRDIIVTSTTRLLHLEDTVTSRPSRPSRPQAAQFQSWHPPPMEAHPTPSPPPPPPDPTVPATPEQLQPRVIIAATPTPPAAIAEAAAPLPAPRKPAVHLPPRPIAQAVPPPPPAPPVRPALGPLPVPTPPPRRPATASSIPMPAPAAAPVPVSAPVPGAPPSDPASAEPPTVETAWEVTSSELQVIDEEALADALRQNVGEADSLPSIPIDLVRLLRPRLGDDDPRQ